MKRTPPLLELTDEHADGSWFVDGEGDLWTACPHGCGWLSLRQLPFAISTNHIELPEAIFGPYVKLLDAEGKRVA